MFLPFFQTLREEGVPVSLREFLSFLEAMAAGLVIYDPEGFYHLARLTLVKDERHIDRFDRAFARAFGGLEAVTADQVLEALDLPRDWLEKLAERHFSAEERAAITALGGFDKLMETLAAPGRAEGAASGRVEMGGDGGNLALRRLWLQPRRRADRAGSRPPPAGGKGLGPARVPQSGRRCRDRHPDDETRAAPVAPLGTGGGGGRAGY